MTLVVHELAHLLHHGGSLKPQPVLLGKLVDLLQRIEKLRGVGADGLSLPRVDAVAF